MTPARGAQTPNLDTARLRSYLDPNGSSGGTATPTPSILGQAPLQGSSSNVGFFTPLTKVYIGDVLDHLEIIVSSMDQFVATCDHLTDYVFVSPLYSISLPEGDADLSLTERLVFPNERFDGEAEYSNGSLLA